MSIIGAPNVYDPIEWSTVKVADQSELQAVMNQMVEAGWFPMQGVFGKLDSAVAIKPTFYVIGWRVKQPALVIDSNPFK